MTKLFYALLLGVALLPLTLTPQVDPACVGFDCTQCAQADGSCRQDSECQKCCHTYRTPSYTTCIPLHLMGAVGPQE